MSPRWERNDKEKVRNGGGIGGQWSGKGLSPTIGSWQPGIRVMQTDFKTKRKIKTVL